MDELRTEEVTPEKENISGEESADIIEMVRAKHKDDSMHSEKFGDVLVMQITICIILLLALAVINILEPELAKDLTVRFREMTGGSTEEFLKKAVTEVISIIND